MRRLRALIAGVWLVLGLAACSSQPTPLTRPPNAGVVTAPDTENAADGAGASLPAVPVPSAAATALLEQSRAQRDRGDLNAAAATIERALSISPDDPLLWIELAELRSDQGDAAAAAEMARKTLTLTSSSSPLARRARRLLP